MSRLDGEPPPSSPRPNHLHHPADASRFRPLGEQRAKVSARGGRDIVIVWRKPEQLVAHAPPGPQYRALKRANNLQCVFAFGHEWALKATPPGLPVRGVRVRQASFVGVPSQEAHAIRLPH